jgi:hypothetical protein
MRSIGKLSREWSAEHGRAMPSVKRHASKIFNEYGEAQYELIGKAVVLTDGKAGTVENVWLDELYGLLRSKVGGACAPHHRQRARHEFPDAFPGVRSGHITVELSIKSGLELTVADNGIGLNEHADPGGLGSRIIKLLVQQLDGTLAYEQLDPGVRLRAPLRGRPVMLESGQARFRLRWFSPRGFDSMISCLPATPLRHTGQT